MFYQSENERQQKLVEQTERVNHAQVYLRQLASLLRHRTFASWYADNSSRFEWAGKAVHERLRRDFIFQIAQSVRGDHETDSTADLLARFADKCDAMAAQIIETYGFTVKAAEARFTFSRDMSRTETIFNFVESRPNIQEADYRFNTFEVRNGFWAFTRLVESRMTLSHHTGHEGFESVLRGLTEDYMLTGYPHDVLAFDATAARNNRPLAGLLLRNGWCSSQWLETEAQVAQYSTKEGVTIHRLKRSKAA